MKTELRLGQAIVDPQTVFTTNDQSRASQRSEMARNRRLRQAQSLMQVANADLTAVTEQADQAETNRVRQRFHQRRYRCQAGGRSRLHSSKRI